MEFSDIWKNVCKQYQINGTYGCKAPQILEYLKGIGPETLILNGDIIDGWQFSRSYFPASHMKVVRQLIKMMEKGTRIIYVAGNYDEVMRRFFVA